ncbi:MAG TPA: MMPL family transporter [Sphingomicrobium sp.]|nr:MMPL family transporter [Sphingomicrobium sp.]
MHRGIQATTNAEHDAEYRKGGPLGVALAALGKLCWQYSIVVVLAWLLAAVVAGFVAGRLPDRLLSGTGDIEGSASYRVDQVLHSDFGRGDSQSLVLVFRSASLDKNPGELSALFNELTGRLQKQPSVESSVTETEIQDVRLLPKAGTGHFLVIDLSSAEMLEAEQQVPLIRAAVAPVLDGAKARHRDLDWALTGRPALTYDLSRFDAQDTARAEFRALPLTLIILIFAFGSIMSALLPLVLAVASRTVVLGIVFLIAGSIDVSNLVLSVVTMLAIALGIDYSLFIIHRYRRELERIGIGDPAKPGKAREELAMRRAMSQSGVAVVYSAATVAIGIGSLLATPLMQTRSVGLGGLFAVLVSLAASLTLVPAFLRMLRSKVLDWPRLFARPSSGDRSRRLWIQWANTVEKKPILSVVTSLGLILAMAAPAVHTRTGFPESEFLPNELEFTKGMKMLEGMDLRGLVAPIVVIVSDTRKERALTPDRAPMFSNFVTQLERDRRVRAVQGPVRSASDGSMAQTMGGALSRGAFTSRDRTKLLFLIIPSATATFAELQDLSKGLPAALKTKDLSVAVGGQAQYYNDFDNAVSDSYPLTVALVLGMSILVLLLFFRAPLASAKALLLNLFSVAAGYGVVVLVFQLGHGSEIFGVAAATEVVPSTVPLAIFCILFGLSMDYEIFLLSRVRTIFNETGDNALSIREALADTGSVITSAALIMVAVFGAFAFTRDVIVQMIGLGLAVAVFVDATLIRSVLGPALMHVAGRWNWWPGKPDCEKNGAPGTARGTLERPN